MNNVQLSQKEVTRTHALDSLAILFFFLGALHLYSFLKRKARRRQEEDGEGLILTKGITLASDERVALLALIVAGMLEIYLF